MALTSAQTKALTMAQVALMTTAEIQQLDASVLTAAQLAYKDKNGKSVLADLSLSQIGQLSRSAIAGLTIAQRQSINAAGFTSAQLDYLLVDLSLIQYGQLSQSAIFGLSSVRIQKLNAAGLTAVQLGYTDASGKALINYLSASQIGNLTLATLSGLSASQVGQLSQSAFSGLSWKQIQSLNAAGFVSAQLAYTDASGGAVLTRLSSIQIGNLSQSLFAALTTAQVQSIDASGLTAIQLGYIDKSGLLVASSLTANKVTALSAQTLSGLSPALMQLLNVSMMTAVQLGYKDTSGKSVVSKLSANQVGALSVQTVAQLNATHLAEMSITQLQLLNAAGLNALQARPDQLMVKCLNGKSVLSNLTVKQVGQLSTQAQGGLNAAHFAVMTVEQIQALNGAFLYASQMGFTGSSGKTVLADLSPAQISRINAFNIGQLTTAQIQSINAAGLTSAQLAYKDKSAKTVLADLSATQVGLLDQKLLAVLTVVQIQSLNAAGLTSAQLTQKIASCLTTMQVQSLNVANLTSEQLGYKDVSGNPILAGISNAQVGQLSQSAILGLTTDQIRSLNASAFTSAQLAYTDLSGKTVLADLSAVQVSVLGESVFNYFTTEQVQSLNVTGLTSAQLGYTVWRGHETIALQDLSSSQVAQLTQAQISGLTDAQLKLVPKDYFTSTQTGFTDRDGHTVGSLFSTPTGGATAQDYLNTYVDMGYWVWGDGTFNKSGLESTLTATMGGSVGSWNNQAKTQLNLGFASVDPNGRIVFGNADATTAEAYEKAASQAAGYVKTNLVGKFKDISVSFGGWTADDVTSSSVDPIIYAFKNGKDAAWLTSFFTQTVSDFGVSVLDFDIENTMSTGPDAVAMNTLRNEALMAFEKANPSVKVSYTLAVDPDGFSAHTLEVLKSAYLAGVDLSSVHLMCMDYTPSKVTGTMAEASISAVKAAEAQLDAIGYKNTNLTIIAMVGKNDVTSEIFTIEDMRSVVDYAYSDSRVTGIGQWSLNADSRGDSGVESGSYTWGSGKYTQAIWDEFTKNYGTTDDGSTSTGGSTGYTPKNYDLSWGSTSDGNQFISEFKLGTDHVVAAAGSSWSDIHVVGVTAADGTFGFEITEAFGDGWTTPGQGYIFNDSNTKGALTSYVVKSYLTQIMSNMTAGGAALTGTVDDAKIDMSKFITMSSVGHISDNVV